MPWPNAENRESCCGHTYLVAGYRLRTDWWRRPYARHSYMNSYMTSRKGQRDIYTYHIQVSRHLQFCYIPGGVSSYDKLKLSRSSSWLLNIPRNDLLQVLPHHITDGLTNGFTAATAIKWVMMCMFSACQTSRWAVRAKSFSSARDDCLVFPGFKSLRTAAGW